MMQIKTRSADGAALIRPTGLLGGSQGETGQWKELVAKN
jgi:hypothetical protein